MKRIAYLVLAALLMSLAAIACSGSGGGGGVVNISGDQLVGNVSVALDKISTFRLSIDAKENFSGVLDGEKGSAAIHLAATGAQDNENQKMQMEMNISGIATGAGSLNAQIKEYLIGDTAYMWTDMPDSPKGWTRYDIPTYMWDTQNYPKKLADIIYNAEIKILKIQKVGGVNCYVVEIHPDVDAVLDMMGSMYGSDMMGLTEDILSDYNCTGWYAQDTFYPMKFYVECNLNMEEGADKLTGKVTMTEELYDYNKPVTVQLPSAARDAEYGGSLDIGG